MEKATGTLPVVRAEHERGRSVGLGQRCDAKRGVPLEGGLFRRLVLAVAGRFAVDNVGIGSGRHPLPNLSFLM